MASKSEELEEEAALRIVGKQEELILLKGGKAGIYFAGMDNPLATQRSRT